MISSARVYTLVLLTVVPLSGTTLSAADEAVQQVEVIVDSATVKVRDEVIGHVKRGERYAVVRVQLPWVAVAVDRDGKRRLGWLPVEKVRAVGHDSGVDKPAPEVPVPVKVTVDLTQVVGLQASRSHGPFPVRGRSSLTFTGRFGRRGGPVRGPNAPVVSADAHYICLRLSLENATTAPLEPADFTLHVDEQALRSIAPSDIDEQLLVYTDGGDEGKNLRELSHWSNVPIKPGATVLGWLCFDISAVPMKDDLLRLPEPDRWVLRGSVGGYPVELDLKANELRELDGTVRPSEIAPTVRVIDVGSRINALNAGELIETIASLSTDSAVIYREKAAGCLYDDIAAGLFQSMMQRRADKKLPSLTVVRPSVIAGQGPGGRSAPGLSIYVGAGRVLTSEAVAALQMLGARTDTGGQIIKHLSNELPEVRAAAAEALATHLHEEHVIDALVAASKDEDANVRVYVAQSLGLHQNPTPGARQDDSSDTAAMIALMHDADDNVRRVAASFSRAFQCSRIEHELIRLLDDDSDQVKEAACYSLRDQGSSRAVEKFKALAQEGNERVRQAATDALVRLGVVSPLDAVLKKLVSGYLTSTDFDVLREAHDLSTVPALIAYMHNNIHDRSDGVIELLGDLGDPRAVDPLLEALPYARHHGSEKEIVEALGKLDDERAVEPLRRGLASAPDEPGVRIAYGAALLMLDAPEALDRLKPMLAAAQNRDDVQDVAFTALARCRRPQALAIIEPYLDKPEYCSTAARALTYDGSPKAMRMLQTRLQSAGYALGSHLIDGLRNNPAWLQSPNGIALLRIAAQSRSDNTRSVATTLLQSLEAAK